MSAGSKPSRVCAIPGCGRSIVAGVLMLGTLAHMVPKAQRDEVWRRLMGYDAQMLLPDIKARVAAIEAFRAAKQAAIDSVVEQLDEGDGRDERA